ncbi:MAG: FeoB-associated Cys-rich membrane protein [Clostridia bacterium]|nr:FeoB-associated Cys-rich membrane protein [Clostridia bacterium]
MVPTIIISTVIAVVVIAIIVKGIKNKKEGKHSCSGSCGGCAMQGNCHKK